MRGMWVILCNQSQEGQAMALLANAESGELEWRSHEEMKDLQEDIRNQKAMKKKQ